MSHCMPERNSWEEESRAPGGYDEWADICVSRHRREPQTDTKKLGIALIQRRRKPTGGQLVNPNMPAALIMGPESSSALVSPE